MNHFISNKIPTYKKQYTNKFNSTNNNWIYIVKKIVLLSDFSFRCTHQCIKNIRLVRHIIQHKLDLFPESFPNQTIITIDWKTLTGIKVLNEATTILNYQFIFESVKANILNKKMDKITENSVWMSDRADICTIPDTSKTNHEFIPDNN